MAPLKLGKSSKNTVDNQDQNPSPEEEYNDDDGYHGEIKESEEDDQAHPARAERVSLHP